MMGFEAMEMYTSTREEVCIRNCIRPKHSQSAHESSTMEIVSYLAASQCDHAVLHVVQEGAPGDDWQDENCV